MHQYSPFKVYYCTPCSRPWKVQRYWITSKGHIQWVTKTRDHGKFTGIYPPEYVSEGATYTLDHRQFTNIHPQKSTLFRMGFLSGVCNKNLIENRLITLQPLGWFLNYTFHYRKRLSITRSQPSTLHEPFFCILMEMSDDVKRIK